MGVYLYMEIVNLIINILSLLATVAISFVIYFLENRDLKSRKEHEIHEQAKRFIIENAEERGYLPWAVVASGCFPQNHHSRKIYNEFTLLDDEVKEEVLRQAGLHVPLIDGFDWVNGKIEALEESSSKLGLGDAFLYEGVKYFHRLYDDKEREYGDSLFGYWDENYKDVFGFDRFGLYKRKGYVPFTRYVDDYLYCKFEKPEKFSDEWQKPFDYLLATEQICETSDEGAVCFWVSHIVEELICYSIKYLGFKEKDHPETDSQAETFEDRYFQILYDLFFIDIPTDFGK